MRRRVVIAGGYGLVGGQLARRLRDADHDLDLILAGRNPDSDAARTLALALNARTLRLDVADPGADLATVGPVDLVVAALQDPGDHLLMASLRAGAGHIGIVGTAGTMASSAIAINALARGPALMLGHWQAGVLTALARHACRDFAWVDRIAMAALFDYGDPIGPMTAADTAGFAGQALIREGGIWTWVDAMSSGRIVSRGGLSAFEAHPMGVLDTPALAAVTGASDVRFDLGVGQSLGSANGGVASHDLYVDIDGTLSSGVSGARRTILSDPRGQAHLTAVGMLIGVERLLGLDGAPPPAAGLLFPETSIDLDRALQRLRDFGVHIEDVA